MTDPYKVLGLPRESTPSQIKKKFRKLAMRYHPDRNRGDPEAQERYRAVVDAYEVLSDPDRRKKFDETGDAACRPAEADMLSFVVPFFLDSLQELHSRGVRASEADVLGMIVDRVDARREAVDKSHGNLLRGLNALGQAKGRFLVEGSGENVLNEVVESKIREVTGQLNMCKDELDRLTRVKNFLKKCEYRTDPEGPTEGSGVVMKMIYFHSST